MTKLFKTLVAVCLLGGFALTALGLLARWVPALDIINNGLPFLALGALGLLVLAWVMRAKRLASGSAVFFAVTLGLTLLSLPGAAPKADDGAQRFLRVATFNLWGRNDHHLDRVARFLDETDADAIVLEEVRRHHTPFLESLNGHYPYSVGDNGLFILSKHPILSDGQTDRSDQPYWMSRIIRWVRLDVNGTPVTLAGVHLARPFYPELQQADIAMLTRFAQSQSGPLILAGDFNMTPWTVKMKDFTRQTKLGRFNTIYPTWPMRWRSLPLFPLIPIDNVFASAHFAKIGLTLGPRLDSDHRPVIADLALIE